MPARQWMIRTGDDDERMRREIHRLRFHVHRRAPHDRQIDLVGHEQTADFFTVIDQQANANIGLDLAKFGEQPGAKYSAVLVTAIATRPPLRPFRAIRDSSASFSDCRICRA